MIVTILWEDQRAALTKGYGPTNLLTACLADALGAEPKELQNRLTEIPLKGVGNVIAELRKNGAKLLHKGPLVAVIDRDKVYDHLRTPRPKTNCMMLVRQAILSQTPGVACDILFLVDNMESLIVACCLALSISTPGSKPTPDQRDTILSRAAWSTTDIRAKVMAACPSFARLVDIVAAKLAKPRS